MNRTTHHITEAYEHYTQESSVEQRSPNDFDYDDVTIGKALSDACRRRADHSEEEGLSSCLSSSVSHDRMVRPVVAPFDSQVSSIHEIQRHSSESEQIRIFLERQREQVLAESQKEEICRAHQGDERLRQDHQLLQCNCGNLYGLLNNLGNRGVLRHGRVVDDQSRDCILEGNTCQVGRLI